MIFSSLTFLGLFLPLVWLLHTLLRGAWRNYWLLLASLIFYAWGEGLWVGVMLTSILVNYGIGLGMNRSPQPRRWLWLGVVCNLGLLGGFKYLPWLIPLVNQTLYPITHTLLPLPDLPLPIGISFFTFQALSYLIDLYRGQLTAQRNPLQLGLYIALFPQLIAGPIVRYQEIYQQLRERVLSLEGMVQGVQRFLVGLAKKVLIADQLAFVVDKIFELPPAGMNTGLAWLAMLCYSLQIYYDFSGYSDMAIGLGRMLGFDIPENFRYPYLARSVREFWRRWHISLSTWFRDYLYIPLGGNQGPRWRSYANLWIVFLLCGLWHGASGTFVLWGAFHGTFLVLERGRLGNWLTQSPRWISHGYTLLVVLLAWVLFRANSLEQAMDFYQHLFGLGDGAQHAYGWFLLRTEAFWPLLTGLLFATPVYLRGEKCLSRRVKLRSTLQPALFLVLGGVCFLVILLNTYTPFIYFRF